MNRRYMIVSRQTIYSLHGSIKNVFSKNKNNLTSIHHIYFEIFKISTCPNVVFFKCHIMSNDLVGKINQFWGKTAGKSNLF